MTERKNVIDSVSEYYFDATAALSLPLMAHIDQQHTQKDSFCFPLINFLHFNNILLHDINNLRKFLKHQKGHFSLLRSL